MSINTKNPNFFGRWRNPFTPLTSHAAGKYRALCYQVKEAFGYPKRDLIVFRVEQTRESFEQAKSQFQSALEPLSNLTCFEGGDLESLYRKLQAEFDLSQKKANEVSNRICAIEKVAEALFDEWQRELGEYNNVSLRHHSRQQLRTTRQQYGRLINMMHRAEAKIKPVLAAFHDQVLFIKHNVNAKAISSLHGHCASVGIDIVRLISSMEKSISEANAFINILVEPRALPQL